MPVHPNLILFGGMAGLAALAAIGVVAFGSAIRSALCLVLNFFLLAFVYFTLHVETLGIFQIVVYTGAIMVLFLFVIMLLNSGSSAIKEEARDPKKFAGIALGLALAGLLASQILPMFREVLPKPVTPGFGQMPSIGRTLFTEYVFPFEVVSILLVVGVVGSILLAKKEGELMEGVPLSAYLALGLFMFCTGVVGVVVRRNPIVIFMCIELMLNSVNLTFLAFARYNFASNGATEIGARSAMGGPMMVVFVMAVAAAEVAVGLGIVMAIFRLKQKIDIDEMNLLRGKQMQSDQLVWVVLGLPFLGFLIQTFFGRTLQKVSKGLVGGISTLTVFGSFAAGLAITKQLIASPEANRSLVVTGPDWIRIFGLHIPFEWVIDPLSMTMVLIITGIGGLIHLYASGYMSEDSDFARFFSYLNLFVVAMLVLVLGNNLALLFVGWEGVGLCSYLLIGFWYKDLANARAANKAFIVNRIGDWGLSLGLFLLAILVIEHQNGRPSTSDRLLSYDVMLPALAEVFQKQPAFATIAGILLFIGAAGKSAQFPLYFWLPDAMAGPTPVSALIHAATMVTSGVVLLNRMNVVLAASPVASSIVCVVGAITALLGALIAFGQTDIKKVLAYSTVSQLGFMFVACGAGAYWVGMFHVTTHAFFKALLFLGAGAVIHAMAHEQDMRRYGRLGKYLPITCATMLIGTAAIAGVPGLSGFFSKEAVLGSALAGTHAIVGSVNFGNLAGWVCLGVAALTAAYMTRLALLTFFGGQEQWRALAGSTADAHDEHHDHHHGLTGDHKPHEVPVTMWLPLAILAVLSIAGGFVLNPVFEKWLYPNGSALKDVELHPAGVPLMALSIGAAVVGILYGVLIYLKGLPEPEGEDESKWSKFRLKARNQFGIDDAFVDLGVNGGAGLGLGLERNLDSGLINDVAIGGTNRVIGWTGRVLSLAQNGVIRLYATAMLAGVVAVLAYVIAAVAGRVR